MGEHAPDLLPLAREVCGRQCVDCAVGLVSPRPGPEAASAQRARDPLHRQAILGDRSVAHGQGSGKLEAGVPQEGRLTPVHTEAHEALCVKHLPAVNVPLGVEDHGKDEGAVRRQRCGGEVEEDGIRGALLVKVVGKVGADDVVIGQIPARPGRESPIRPLLRGGAHAVVAGRPFPEHHLLGDNLLSVARRQGCIGQHVDGDRVPKEERPWGGDHDVWVDQGHLESSRSRFPVDRQDHGVRQVPGQIGALAAGGPGVL
mmetsp:Transcript_21402/g.62341  ORF Transcript_21402/g.62341 Transcript_21402/m.62341 type:complete len:258 (-) Transcript_21402:1163-1936(-)